MAALVWTGPNLLSIKYEVMIIALISLEIIVMMSRVIMIAIDVEKSIDQAREEKEALENATDKMSEQVAIGSYVKKADGSGTSWVVIDWIVYMLSIFFVVSVNLYKFYVLLHIHSKCILSDLNTLICSIWVTE